MEKTFEEKLGKIFNIIRQDSRAVMIGSFDGYYEITISRSRDVFYDANKFVLKDEYDADILLEYFATTNCEASYIIEHDDGVVKIGPITFDCSMDAEMCKHKIKSQYNIEVVIDEK